MTKDGNLSKEEFVSMVKLLKRYVEHDMDQWELWRFETERSTVFVDVSLYPTEGAAEDAYTDLTELFE